MKKNTEPAKYVLNQNNYVLEDLKTINDYFTNKKYNLCLVGNKESITEDLKEKKYEGKEFIHLTNKNLKEVFPFFDIKIKNKIKRINGLISNPENDFNKTKLGIHTLGLVPVEEIHILNSKGFGLYAWNGLKVYIGSSHHCWPFQC
jgi:hypothetical protein